MHLIHKRDFIHIMVYKSLNSMRYLAEISILCRNMAFFYPYMAEIWVVRLR